jgi:hypothetical protein
VLPRTTLVRRSARASSAIMAKANSPSLFERTILGCLKHRMPSPLLVAVPLSRALAMTEQPTIIVVDDDPEIREALGSLIRSVGV